MVLLQKRAHLLLKPTLMVVRLLPVDVTHQSPNLCWPNGKQTIPTLPRKIRNALLFHPNGRTCLDLGNNLRGRSRRGQSQRKMNVIRNAAHAKTLAIQSTRQSGNVSMKPCKNIVMDQWCPMFRTKNDVNQIETQRLCHRTDYMSPVQPSCSCHSASPEQPGSTSTKPQSLRPNNIPSQTESLGLHSPQP